MSSNLQAVVRDLQRERQECSRRLTLLDQALRVLNGGGGRRNWTMSAEGRAKIAAAQRARWAKQKKQSA